MYWLDNSFVEGFKLPTLEEADLVNVAHMMLLARRGAWAEHLEWDRRFAYPTVNNGC